MSARCKETLNCGDEQSSGSETGAAYSAMGLNGFSLFFPSAAL